MHGGDRNRTSPFAFTGNKFEFRALGSSMSLAFPNTVLNTIVAEAIDDLAALVETKVAAGMSVPEGRSDRRMVKDYYSANKQVCFGGDNYSEEWHAEAEQRGLKNLRTTPDALPEVLKEESVAAFENYEVLSRRELESRYEVWLEQYAIRANIEAEGTASSIAQTMILPAALRHLALLNEAGVSSLEGELRELIDQLVAALGELEAANAYPSELEGLELAVHARDKQMAAMAAVREFADHMEKVVADDLWPLPKYEEMLLSSSAARAGADQTDRPRRGIDLIAVTYRVDDQVSDRDQTDHRNQARTDHGGPRLHRRNHRKAQCRRIVGSSRRSGATGPWIQVGERLDQARLERSEIVGHGTIIRNHRSSHLLRV